MFLCTTPSPGTSILRRWYWALGRTAAQKAVPLQTVRMFTCTWKGMFQGRGLALLDTETGGVSFHVSRVALPPLLSGVMLWGAEAGGV